MMEQPERLLLMKEWKEQERLSRLLRSEQFFKEKIQLVRSSLKVSQKRKSDLFFCL
jgi:hypothetical protein